MIAGCERRDGSVDGTAPSAPPAAAVPPGGDAGTGFRADGGSGAGSRQASTSQPTAGRSADAPAADVQRVRSQLAEVDRHLKNKQPDLARRALEEAELVQGSLPVELREQIRQMRTRVATAAARGAPPPPPPAAPEGDDEENK